MCVQGKAQTLCPCTQLEPRVAAPVQRAVLKGGDWPHQTLSSCCSGDFVRQRSLCPGTALVLKARKGSDPAKALHREAPVFITPLGAPATQELTWKWPNEASPGMEGRESEAQ